MLKKIFYTASILIFTIGLVACDNKVDNNKPDNPIVKPAENPKPNPEPNPEPIKQELNIKEVDLTYKLSELYPNSFVNNVKGGYTNLTIDDSITVNKRFLYYRNTPLYNQMSSVLNRVDEILSSIENVYNTVFSELIFYDDLTIDSNELSTSYSVVFNRLDVDDSNNIIEFDVIISGTSADLNIPNYQFEGDFDLQIVKSLENNLVINLTPKDDKYFNEANEITGINFNLNQSNFEIKFYEVKESNEEVNIINLNKEDNGYTSIIVDNQLLNEYQNNNKNMIKSISNHMFFYGNESNGALLNRYENHIYSNKETVKLESYSDFEVVNSKLGVVYKSLTGSSKEKENNELIESKKTVTGWPGSLISNWSSAEISNENVEITLNDSNSYNQKHLLNNKLSYTLNDSSNLIKEAKTGFQIIEGNIYEDVPLNIFGYFTITDNVMKDFYKQMITVDKTEFPTLEVNTTYKKNIHNMIVNFYNFMLKEEDKTIENPDIPDIINTIDQVYLSEKDLLVISGYDCNHNLAIKVYNNNNQLVDYFITERTIDDLIDIKYENERLMTYGISSNLPYLLSFAFDENNKIDRNLFFEYINRREGIIDFSTYNSIEKKYITNMVLDDGNVETLNILEDEDMMPLIIKHIEINHNHDTYITPEYIVIHETANPTVGTDARWHYEYFNRTSREASTQFTVDDTTVYQILNRKDNQMERAWHVGDGDGSSGILNGNSVGMEICVNEDGDYEKARQNAITLTVYLLKEFNLSPDRVVRHYDASGKMCPATMLAHPELWDDFKAQVTKTYNEWMSTK